MMTDMHRCRVRFYLLVACLSMVPAEAQAYVDPSTGGAIISAILGAVGAVVYTFRKYYYKIKKLFKKDAPR